MKYKIIRATSLDCNKIITLNQLLANQSKFLTYDAEEKAGDLTLATDIDSNKTLCLLLKGNNYLQGYVSYQYDELMDKGCISMGILKKTQGMGYGTLLLKALLALLIKLKINKELYLYVHKDNVVAVNLYKKFDFEVSHEDDKTYYMVLKME